MEGNSCKCFDAKIYISRCQPKVGLHECCRLKLPRNLSCIFQIYATRQMDGRILQRPGSTEEKDYLQLQQSDMEVKPGARCCPKGSAVFR